MEEKIISLHLLACPLSRPEVQARAAPQENWRRKLLSNIHGKPPVCPLFRSRLTIFIAEKNTRAKLDILAFEWAQIKINHLPH